MDKETENLLDTIAQKAASDAVLKVREFHHDDLKVVGERIDIGFAKVERELQETNTRLDRVEGKLQETNTRFVRVEGELQETNTRLDRVENALAMLLQEFKSHQEKQRQLEAQIAELTERVIVLEKQLSHR